MDVRLVASRLLDRIMPLPVGLACLALAAVSHHWPVTVALGVVLSAPNLFYTQVERHNDAAAALAEGQSGADLDADLAGWPDYLPSGLVNLGLDLRGGAQLLAEGKTAEAAAVKIEETDFAAELKPLLATLRTYRLAWLGKDSIAGLSACIVSIPSVIAYAELVHLPPIAGLYAALAAAISALSSASGRP